MFLELPAITFPDYEEDDEKTFSPQRFDVLLNPIHVIAIEPDTKNSCFVIMTGEVSYKITMSRTKTKNAIEDFVKQNILSKFYKEIKDQQGEN
jgi:hypothetical protein